VKPNAAAIWFQAAAFSALPPATGRAGWSLTGLARRIVDAIAADVAVRAPRS